MVWMLLFLAICCFISALVQRLSGFGLATLLMALLPIFMNFTDALVITGVVGCVGSVALAIQQRRYIQWKKLAIPVAAYVVVGFFVTRLVAANAAADFKRWLGLFLFALALYFILLSKRIHIKGSVPSGLLVGAISGVGNNLFNVGGPPMAVYLLNVCDSNLAYLATMQVFLAIISGYTNIVRAASGMFYIGILPMVPAAVIGMALGFLVGGRIFHKLDGEKLKTVVYVVVAASGLWIFFGDLLGFAV